jgi:hypothetical protein
MTDPSLNVYSLHLIKNFILDFVLFCLTVYLIQNFYINIIYFVMIYFIIKIILVIIYLFYIFFIKNVTLEGLQRTEGVFYSGSVARSSSLRPAASE